MLQSPQLEQPLSSPAQKTRAHQGPAAYTNVFPMPLQSWQREVCQDEKASEKCQDPSSFQAPAAISVVTAGETATPPLNFGQAFNNHTALLEKS